MEKFYNCLNSSKEANEMSVLQTDSLAISRAGRSRDWGILSLIHSLSLPVNMIFKTLNLNVYLPGT